MTCWAHPHPPPAPPPPQPRTPSHLPGHKAMLQNFVCFSGPSQGLPPNCGGLQVRVRSRKPRPQVLEQRLQGDHSSQAPCTVERQEALAVPKPRGPAPPPSPAPQPQAPPHHKSPAPSPQKPRPVLCSAHLDTQRSCCRAAAPSEAHCTECCRRTTRRSGCGSASPRRRCWSTRSTGTIPRLLGHLWVQPCSIMGLPCPFP